MCTKDIELFLIIPTKAIGEWSTWNSWSACNCPCPKRYKECFGTKSRNRDCINKSNGLSTYPNDCTTGKMNDNVECLKTCKPKNVLTMKPVTSEISKPQDRSTSTSSSTSSILENKYLFSVMLGCFAITLLGFVLLLYLRQRRKKRKGVICTGVEDNDLPLSEGKFYSPDSVSEKLCS